MKPIQLKFKCEEDWNEMSPTLQGKFCQKCQFEVTDFTQMSSIEIKTYLSKNLNNRICIRAHDAQFEQLNHEHDTWKMSNVQVMRKAMFFSLVIVFGMTLFSCSSHDGEKTIQELHRTTINAVNTLDKTVQLLAKKEYQEEEKAPLVKRVKEQIFEWRHRKDPVEDTLEKDDYYIHGGSPVFSESFKTFIKDEVAQDSTEALDTLVEIREEIPVLTEEAIFVFEARVYPNPVPAATTLKVVLPSDQPIFSARLFAMNGNLLSEITEENLFKGAHKFPIIMQEFPPAIYLLQIQSNDYSETLQVVKR